MHSTPPNTCHDTPNSAFQTTTSPDSWIELYHSRPSWKLSQISFRKNSEDWVPFGKYQVRSCLPSLSTTQFAILSNKNLQSSQPLTSQNLNKQLLDASDIRPGFRAFRLRAIRLEFRFANEHATTIDSNLGRNYIIESPGRYVVETASGCRRISDAQIADCLRPIRPADKLIELIFRSPSIWRRCFVNFALEGDHDNSTWCKMPMHRQDDSTIWFQRIEAPRGITCAFSDGARQWDSNNNSNYHIRLPGKYTAGGGFLIYCGPSDLDMHLM